MRIHTVAGPVVATLPVADRAEACALFERLADEAVERAAIRHLAPLGRRRAPSSRRRPMPAERAGRLGVGTIGAGRVGAVLAAALAGAGHALTGIAAVSDVEP